MSDDKPVEGRGPVQVNSEASKIYDSINKEGLSLKDTNKIADNVQDTVLNGAIITSLQGLNLGTTGHQNQDPQTDIETDQFYIMRTKAIEKYFIENEIYTKGIPYYDMSRNMGHCLIINIRNFKSLPKRMCATNDSKKLMKIMGEQGLGFQCNSIDTDSEKSQYTLSEVKTILEKYTDEAMHEDMSAFVLFFMSHGENDNTICCYDESISIADIIKMFQNCSSLKGKPKLFFFQACRGREENEATYEHKSNFLKGARRFESSCWRVLTRIPQYSDIFIAYSTTPGHVDNMDNYGHSLFITALTKVLALTALPSFNYSIGRGNIKEKPISYDIFQIMMLVGSCMAELDCFEDLCSVDKDVLNALKAYNEEHFEGKQQVEKFIDKDTARKKIQLGISQIIPYREKRYTVEAETIFQNILKSLENSARTNDLINDDIYKRIEDLQKSPHNQKICKQIPEFRSCLRKRFCFKVNSQLSESPTE